MASVLFRVGRFCFRHKWWIVAAWLAALVVVVSLVQALSPKFAKDFSLPGTDAGVATEQMKDYFPQVTEQQKQASTSVLVQADDGLANHTEGIDSLVSDLKSLPKVDNADEIANPVAIAQAKPQLASSVLGDDGKVGLIQVDQDIDRIDLTVDNKNQLTTVMDQHRGDGLQVEATGALMQVMDAGGSAELIGFAVAFVIMIVAFGALIAAFIPLVTGIVGVLLTIELFTLGAEFLSINDTATSIIMMLGIAVSIDYALFIVSRYRSEAGRGGDPADAAGRAVGTAGSAVIFAGLTVIIAVVALTVIGIPMITQMGAGAGMAVAVAVLGAITLIPALLGAFGRFAFKPRIPWIRHAEPSEETTTNGVRWGRLIAKRPIGFIIVGLALLAVAAIPVSKLELGLNMQSDDEAAAMDLMAEGFGEGINGPLFAVVHSDGGNVAPAANTVVDEISTFDDVADPQSLTWVGNGTQNPANRQAGADTALISVTPLSSPSSQETHDLMNRIRDVSPSVQSQGAQLHVGGQTAIMSDLSSKLSSALIPYLVVVVGLAFLIMIGVFRSLWVPLVGTLGFVFSVAATFGLTVLIFQEGALGLISNTQPILSFLPIFLIGLVFGLAMDYQVFLVTRMREEYMHGMSAKDAIIAGYRHGARVVASAAVIMIAVFAAFMLSPDTTAKMLGFSLAIAVFFDAFIIRMTVVPAVLAMLGDRAWRLPKWLDKAVLDFDIEGGAIKDRGLESVTDEGAPGAGEPVPAGSR